VEKVQRFWAEAAPAAATQSFINHNCGFVTSEIAATVRHLPGFGRSRVTVDF